MAIPSQVRRGLVAVLLFIALVLQATTSVLAGTTGAINGTVVDPSSNQPVSGAQVTAASPSQTANTNTDSTGHFSFLSLAPDTYTVSVASTSTREAASVSGVTVQADQTLTVALQQPTKLKVIGSVTSRSNSALVKPGTTADVYSISAVTQDKASTFGSGGTLNSAWSAITSVPGVFVAPNQSGYIGAGDGVSIRGGDYDQIGYEVDGVPVNRSFDNYPSSQLSSLGQQEVQVYTGAEPANAEAEGLSGFINQVIKSGTSPAYRSLDLATGSSTPYGRIAFETGGSTPSRTFSYYVGVGAYNQDYRPIDNYDGASLDNLYGTPIGFCGPTTPSKSCYNPQGVSYTNGGATPAYVLGPFSYGDLGEVQDRDTVVNLHFAIPRKDGNRDDVQFLYDNSHLNNIYLNSENDAGGAAFLNAVGIATTYDDSYTFTGAPLGGLLPVGYTGGGLTPYLAPGSPSGRAFNSLIPPNTDDAFVNDQAIVKLQYQHNFGTSAYLRIYGYTDYSDWLNQGPVDDNTDFIGPVSPDYELSAHARGVSLQFSDQINSQNLVTFQTNYTTSTTLRMNNFYYLNGVNVFGTLPGAVDAAALPGNLSQIPVIGLLVNGANPYSGQCYANGGTPVPCFAANGLGLNLTGVGAGPPVGFFTFGDVLGGTVTPATGTCGTGPCQYLVAQNGTFGEYNQVVPKFFSASMTDNWQPTSKLSVSAGLRFDQFQFTGASTCSGAVRNFFFAAYNAEFPTTPLSNTPCVQTNTFDEVQPRLSGTYTINPTTVLRASYGRYAQAPNSAFEQYNFLEADSPIGFPAGAGQFDAFGVGNTSVHDVRPEVSNNYDFSFEHSFGNDLSVKISPFLRQTQDQIEEFFLNQQTSFVSGLNVGRQRSEGVEVELDKGDFSRNGFAGKLSFTYTNSYINYEQATGANGPYSVLTGINAAIAGYDAFTKKGGGSPCYTTAGAPTACAAGDVANPYYNAPYQPQLSLTTDFPTYSLFPAGVGSFATPTYGAPFVTTLLLQYKHDKLAITPALQLSGGQRYGAPIAANGIDPSTCTGVLGAPVTGSGIKTSPLYPYGAAGGNAYDATTCGGTVAIPNPQTGIFDGIGAFVDPASLQLHIQITYDVTKRLTLVASLVNVYQNCFGGTKVPWAVKGACGYTEPILGEEAPIGNIYNNGYVIQPALSQEYVPTFGSASGAGFPFQAYFEARLRI